MIERTIVTPTHGRYLLELSTSNPAPLLVGFHGYGEDAEAQMDRLRGIPGSDGWTLVSIQALHRFYRGRTEQVVGSWMTRQDRDLAIADNLAYVAAVLDALIDATGALERAVFSGFSQGVAMAFRAAAAARCAVAGVIANGGDVPPELDAVAIGRIRAALVGRGLRDDWYTSAKLAADLDRLRAARVAVRAFEGDAGHEWTQEFSRAAAACLQEWR